MNARATMTGWLRDRGVVPVQAVRPILLCPVAVRRPQDWAFRWEQR